MVILAVPQAVSRFQTVARLFKKNILTKIEKPDKIAINVKSRKLLNEMLGTRMPQNYDRL